MNWQPPQILTRGAEPPVPIALARDWLREEPAQDAQIDEVLRAAAGQVEADVALYLTPVTATLRVDGFGDLRQLELLRGPVTEITAVKYLDSSGVEQTLSTDLYRVVPSGERAFLQLAHDAEWPSTAEAADAVRISASLGFADWNAVPFGLRQAVKLLLANWWMNREAVNVGNITSELPLGYDRAIAPFRRWVVS
ncbi:MAG: phage head-tail connector protein [Alphaproteobacteria bacterium]|nr:phage head-tail connector protein [Alphaproteobacteria bacterium]